MRPRRSPGVTRRDVGADECVLLSAAADRAVVLNALGAVVWDLCDGEHTDADIATVIAARYAEVPASRVAADVRALLGELGGASLIEDVDACGGGASGR